MYMGFHHVRGALHSQDVCSIAGIGNAAGRAVSSVSDPGDGGVYAARVV